MGLCDVPVISSVCEAVGEGPAALITAPFDWLAQSVANAAAWLFEGVWMIFESTTLVDITGGGYIGVYNIVFGIGVLVTFAFFCLQLLGGLIRREPGALARAATGMAKSILGGFVLVVVTGILLEIVDQLCIGIVQASGNTMEQMGTKIGLLIGGLIGLNLAAPGAAAIIVIFLGFMAIAAGAIVWFSLLIRKALILVLVVLGPIALAGANWDVTRGWFAKWASFVLALIFSKFVVVLVFLVAITQVNAPIDLDISAISDPVAGIVLMLVAGFAPYMCYKLLAFAGVDMYALASTEQEAKQSVNRPVPIPHKPDAPSQLLEGSSSMSSRPPVSSPLARRARGWTRLCCWRWTRSGTLRRCPRCRR
ncbi:MAG: conjugal transfer protein TrbL [Cumulibacter sp.]